MEPENEIQTCCICGQKFIGWGNNPDGAAWRTVTGEIELPEFYPTDKCCDECNRNYVIPGRLYRMSKAKKESEAEHE